MQDSAQPCTSTSTSGCTNRNDSKINQAVRLINALKHENKKLNTENTELREHLAVITQRHNELLTNEARVVDHEQDVCAPTAQNETIQMLTRQVETLKLELEGKQNVCPEDVLQQEEYNNIIEDYRKAIKTKDEEIHKLRAKCGQPEMARKISKLENMLDKARGTIRIFADQIEALKLEMQSMTKESQASSEGVTIQAASADDDVNGHHNTSPRQSVHTVDSVSRDEYEKVKELNLTLQDKLNAAVTAKETATAELVTTRADNANLREEKAQLLRENESLKQNSQQGELMQTQMKAFMEDFTLERQEKQQLMELKENLRGENTNLKQHLNELNALLAQQQHAAQTQPYKPAMSHTGIIQAVYEHDQVQPFHDRYANPQSGMPMHVPNAPPPQVSRQQSSLVHSRAPPMQESSIRPMAAPVESQPRRIGFPQTNPQLEASHNLPNAGYMQQASPPPAFQAEAYDYHRTPVQPQHRYPRTSSDGHVESMQPQSLPNQSPPEKH